MGDKDKPTGAENPAQDDPLEGVNFEDGVEEPTSEQQPGTPEGEGDSDSTAAPATPTDEGDEKEGEEFINQEAVNKRVNELTFKRHEEKRKREEAEAELAETKKKLAEITQQGDVVIPPVPDAWDPEFETKMKARDEAIEKKVKLDADKAAAKAVHEQAIQEQQRAVQSEILDNVKKMYDSVEDLGIKADDLKASEDKVVQFIKDPGLARFILAQENSALIITHLAASANDLVKVSQMDPISASAYIATTIASEAAKLKPGKPGAPPPLDVPSGRAGGEGKSPYLEGVTFE